MVKDETSESEEDEVIRRPAKFPLGVAEKPPVARGRGRGQARSDSRSESSLTGRSASSGTGSKTATGSKASQEEKSDTENTGTSDVYQENRMSEGISSMNIESAGFSRITSACLVGSEANDVVDKEDEKQKG